MSVQAAGVDPNDWLAVVNTYRSQSGLPPIANNPAWAAGTQNHACWMLLNGIAHDEAPGTPGYTVEGDVAGNSSNVAVSSTASTNAQGPHRPVDVRSVPRHRHPATEPDAGVVRTVHEPAQSEHDAVEVGRRPRRAPRPDRQLAAVRADRVPRQRRDHEPHPVHRRIAGSAHVLRMERAHRRSAAHRHDAGDARPRRRRR